MLKHKITAKSPEPDSYTKTIWAFDYCPDEQVLRMEYYYNYIYDGFLNPRYTLKIPATPADLEQWAAGQPVKVEIAQHVWNQNILKSTLTIEQNGYALLREKLINAQTGVSYYDVSGNYAECIGVSEEDFKWLKSLAKSKDDYWGRPALQLGCEWSPKICTKFRKLLKKFAASAKVSC